MTQALKFQNGGGDGNASSIKPRSKTAVTCNFSAETV